MKEISVANLLFKLIYKRWCILKNVRKEPMLIFVYYADFNVIKAISYYLKTKRFSHRELSIRQIKDIYIVKKIPINITQLKEMKKEYSKYILREKLYFDEPVITNEQWNKIEKGVLYGF